jgi:hypothetical protein
VAAPLPHILINCTHSNFFKTRETKEKKMAQQYVSSVPSDGSLKPGIASFFESFYAVSDTAAAHEQYADHFTSDAKLIMASKETSGRDGKAKKKNEN